MKLALALLALVAAASGYKVPSTGSGALAREFQDIMDMLPVSEIKQLVNAYLVQDREFVLAIDFVTSKEAKELVIDLEAAPEFKKFVNYLQNAGFDAYYLVQKINDALEIETVSPLEASDRKISGGLRGFANDMMDIVPLNKMTELLDRKMTTSKVFFDYVNECMSPEYTDYIFGITSNPHFVKLLEQVEEAGVDSKAFNNQFFILLGIKVVMMQQM